MRLPDERRSGRLPFPKRTKRMEHTTDSFKGLLCRSDHQRATRAPLCHSYVCVFVQLMAKLKARCSSIVWTAAPCRLCHRHWPKTSQALWLCAVVQALYPTSALIRYISSDGNICREARLVGTECRVLPTGDKRALSRLCSRAAQSGQSEQVREVSKGAN